MTASRTHYQKAATSPQILPVDPPHPPRQDPLDMQPTTVALGTMTLETASRG
jgi:hypothetical protein